MNGDTVAFCDESDNGVAGERVAALCEFYVAAVFSVNYNAAGGFYLLGLLRLYLIGIGDNSKLLVRFDYTLLFTLQHSRNL